MNETSKFLGLLENTSHQFYELEGLDIDDDKAHKLIVKLKDKWTPHWVNHLERDLKSHNGKVVSPYGAYAGWTDLPHKVLGMVKGEPHDLEICEPRPDVIYFDHGVVLATPDQLKDIVAITSKPKKSPSGDFIYIETYVESRQDKDHAYVDESDALLDLPEEWRGKVEGMAVSDADRDGHSVIMKVRITQEQLEEFGGDQSFDVTDEESFDDAVDEFGSVDW